MHERIQKKLFEQRVQKIKENNEKLKSIEVDVVNNFVKDEVQSFSDAKFFAAAAAAAAAADDDDDDDDSEEDRVIGFR